MGSPLLELPLETLTEIVEYAGDIPRGDDPWTPNRAFWALLGTCRDLHELTEDLAERHIKKTHGSLMLKVLSRSTTPETNIHRKRIQALRWTSKLCLARIDLGVFGPSSVPVDNRGEMVYGLTTNEQYDISRGYWRLVESKIWGTTMYAANIVNLRLVVPAVLSMGCYAVWLDLSSQSSYMLRAARFFIADTPGVEFYWKKFVPHELYNNLPIAKRDDFMKSSRKATENLGEVHLVKVCLGTLIVSGDASDGEKTCRRIEFVIEDEGMALKRGICFNCVQFVRMSDSQNIEGDRTEWYQHPRPPALRICENPALRSVMSAFHDLKLLDQTFEHWPRSNRSQ